MPVMHLRFTYNACGLFNKNEEQIKKFKETREFKETPC